MFDIQTTTINVQCVAGENVFPIPFPQRGIISRIVLVEVGSTPAGVAPIFDLYESERAASYSSSSGGNPTEDNEEHQITFDPYSYKVCPQMTGVVRAGKGLMEVFAENGGYSYYCRDYNQPAIGTGGPGGQNKKKLYGKITLPGVASPSSWNLTLQAVVKG